MHYIGSAESFSEDQDKSNSFDKILSYLEFYNLRASDIMPANSTAF